MSDGMSEYTGKEISYDVLNITKTGIIDCKSTIRSYVALVKENVTVAITMTSIKVSESHDGALIDSRHYTPLKYNS